jgi:protein-tyrosine phosphatase
MAEVLTWQGCSDPHELVHRAHRSLLQGDLVALPTETVYGIAAHALCPQAVERLLQCKGRPETKPLTLALPSPGQAFDWVPQLGKLGRRLSRRCWPGPVTLVFPQNGDPGLASRLPESVYRRVCGQGSVGIRVPDHEAIQEVMRLLPGPLVLTSANRSGEPDAITGRQVLEVLGARLDLLIDAGTCRYGQASSVVRVEGDRWELLREGVVPARTLERLSSCVILFLCTGNTCRSPLAEGLCKKLLAERLNCGIDELAQRGFVVLSAGVSAMMGCSAAPEAVETARARGVMLEEHISQPLSRSLLAQADYVFGMTRGHLNVAANRFPRVGPPMQLLAPDGEDIPDPVGGSREDYESCADQIEKCLARQLPLLQP